MWWQSAAGNWAGPNDPAGATIPSGYTELRFWAWGAHGGEALTFMAGIGLDSKDGFASKLDVKLKAQPTQYTLGLAVVARLWRHDHAGAGEFVRERFGHGYPFTPEPISVEMK